MRICEHGRIHTGPRNDSSVTQTIHNNIVLCLWASPIRFRNGMVQPGVLEIAVQLMRHC